MKMGWRLGVTLLLLGAGAAVLHFAPPVTADVNPSWFFSLPMAIGEWDGADGVPDDILPGDPSEKLSVRRTYKSGGRVAWVSVSLFVSQDDEARRGSINKVYPQRNVSLIEAVPFTARLGMPSASVITLPAVLVHLESERQQLLVAYWHQIGNNVYGSEYAFRLALMRDLIFTRRADTLLIRIATPSSRGRPVSEDLSVVASLAPSVYAALQQERAR
jgi:EpsI family protein